MPAHESSAPTRIGPPAKYLYTISETAQTLGLSRSTIFEMLADGRLLRVKEGNKALVPWESVQAYYDRLVAQARADRAAVLMPVSA